MSFVKVFWLLGSGCGAVGRAVTFDTRVRIKPSAFLFTINCVQTTEFKKKRGREWPNK